ncbi:MAG: hypothetical protein H0V25_09615 [Solirubrobacterales bacterium]|nr:hypothetical protein [Solirubrobacterales bacterium]
MAPEEAPPQAQSAAEGFAADYVRYAYGLAAATEITDASPELVAILERKTPQVSAFQAQSADTAEATGVNLSMASETAANGVMTVRAKDSLYKLKFELREDRGQWLVTDVSATG